MQHLIFLALYEICVIVAALFTGGITALILWAVGSWLYPHEAIPIFSGIAGYFAAFIVLFLKHPIYWRDRYNLGLER